uniref:Putative isocitrate dehydrogenase [NAD] gamma 2, mitochondrial n=1 Tax=Lygus hesperus TaxID=30085 RepID=A0A0A9XSH0_LYGHE
MILYQTTKVVFRGLMTTGLKYARPVKVPPPMSESHHPFFDPWFDSSPRGTQPRTKAGSKHTITIIPGIGIGKEMIESVLEVFDCCGAPVIPEWITDSENDNDVNFMQTSVNRNGVGIKGNIENRSTWQIVKADTESRNFVFQEALDLFAHVTVLKSFPSLKKHSRIHRDMDIIVIRSNTEGEFALLEHQVGPGIYEHLRVISAYNTRRVSEFAFRKAEMEGRKKVTV